MILLDCNLEFKLATHCVFFYLFNFYVLIFKVLI